MKLGIAPYPYDDGSADALLECARRAERLGFGVGWNPLEYAALGVPLEDRFERMDEYLQTLRQLLHERKTSYSGKYVGFADVQMKPFAAGRIPIWIGSGAATPRPFDDPAQQAATKLSRRGARRIAGQDGWIVSSTATPELHRADWLRIRAEARALGKDPETITRVAYDFCYLVDTNDRERALAEQEIVFRRYFGYTKTWEYILAHNLVGTADDIARRMVERVQATGVSWWILHCMVPDPDQVNALAEEILPRFRAFLKEAAPYAPPADSDKSR